TAFRTEQNGSSYPPYNIEIEEENRYTISLAVAGFTAEDLDIEVKEGVLTVRGRKAGEEQERHYLHQGIANRAFQRKFNLAEHVRVAEADLSNGLLTIRLIRELPEAMRPIQIPIQQSSHRIESQIEKH
ncbi:MAG TPA: heat-shock protein, partial [Gammaproteobacteria bacterium]|nr:heat-shock protein [Gammaproteobacteria bacterium]